MNPAEITLEISRLRRIRDKTHRNPQELKRLDAQINAHYARLNNTDNSGGEQIPLLLSQSREETIANLRKVEKSSTLMPALAAALQNLTG